MELIYSAVRTKEEYDDALLKGFNYSYIHFTNSKELAFSRSPYVISISEIDKLNILLVNNNTPFTSDKKARDLIRGYDGIKYHHGETHDIEHMVWNINELNKLKRTGEYTNEEN